MELIVSISSIVVAISALFVVVWQTFVQRKHNRLSVIPRLSFGIAKTPTDNMSMGINLMNKGLGPAIITKFELSLDGESIEDNGFDNYGGWAIVVEKLNLRKTLQFHWITEDHGINAGEIFSLLSPSNNNETECIKNFYLKFDEILKRIAISIEYESIYGSKQKIKLIQGEIHRV